MDLTQIGKAFESVAKLTDAGKEFLDKVLGPGATEMGLLIQDQVRWWRFKNQVTKIERARKLLDDAGLEATEVPLRTLVPLLEGAALDDDDSLSEKWACLLANAAAKTVPEATHPAFPRLLSELTPQEAAFLDSLMDAGGEANWSVFQEEMTKKLGVEFPRAKSTTHLESRNGFEIYGNVSRLGLAHTSTISSAGAASIKISSFGRAFMRACAPPPKGTSTS